MNIDCLSDLHGFYPDLEGGDLLILAGDYTKADKTDQWLEFYQWLKDQDYNKKILVAGNHDNFLQSCLSSNTSKMMNLFQEEGFEYLCDSGCEYKGFNIWGSPWTKTFKGMNPKCKAFTFNSEAQLSQKFNLIPSDTHLLITHSPPYGILDGITNEDGSDFHIGSTSLRNMVISRERLPNLNLHCFGHIHEWGGKIFETNYEIFVNASLVNERYEHVNNAMRIVLEESIFSSLES